MFGLSGAPAASEAAFPLCKAMGGDGLEPPTSCL
jgi:hypothetical protein